jgi:prepilin-type N-terminal cleavage/methylation domain-containing protein
MSRSGFTLIELMIVVAIIALIAAIAIPSLLRSRMAANETSAIASLKTYSQSQEIFHRHDWDTDGIREYAQNLGGSSVAPMTFPNLIDKVALDDNLVGMIDRSLANAEGEPGVATPKAGYCFAILSTHDNPPASYITAAGGSSMTLGHALSAIPVNYDVSGMNSYMLNQSGVIYQKDRGGQLPQETNYDINDTTVGGIPWTVNQ